MAIQHDMLMRMRCPYLSLIVVLLAPLHLAADDGVSFTRDVGPLLQRRCLSCHNDRDRRGGFSIQDRDDVIGSHVIAGDVASSYLLDLVSATATGERMPPEGESLTAGEIDLLRRWVSEGAAWPAGQRLEEAVITDTDWWSLRPLNRPTVPANVDEAIDEYVRQRLSMQGMVPAPEADRRTLIRRLSIDLCGLPPSPEEVAAFVTDDDPQAYERLVERFLASPQYGEHWARYWLDIVHYGETHGYDKDKLRPNAWPYRDYVIRAFNNDIPYSVFIEQQLAGDVLYPDTAEGIEALGFIAAGPWDFIGHAEVSEAKIDGKIARHLDRDDMVQNTLTTFCSLTVGCAQCHNHKFDPITQEDYYALHAVFAAVDRADKTYDRDPQVARQRRNLRARQAESDLVLDDIHAEIADFVGDALDDLGKQFSALRQQQAQHPPQHGYHSQIEKLADQAKWVQIDLGETQSIHEVRLYPCYDDFNGIGAGFGFPTRYRVEASDDENFLTGVQVIVDLGQEDQPNPQLHAQCWPADALRARYVRVTATRLAPRSADYIFAMSEFMALNETGQNLAAGKPVMALDSIEAPIRWGRANLTDGVYPTSGYHQQEWDALEAEQQRLLTALVPADVLQREREAVAAAKVIESQLAALPAQQQVYAGTVYHGQGTFRGTGHEQGRPREIRLLHRGDVRTPGDVVGPGTLSCFSELPSRFELEATADEGARRAALAHWITDRRNPLTWRSIVNRVWQGHFGRGLVETSSDFGRMGQLPSHPELLDYLAAQFRDEGQSIKTLQRQIVLSRTYRQASLHPDEVALSTLDAENRLLWKFPLRRHSAEVLRDSLLLTSGLLDLTPGGPGFQDFVIEHPEHSPHFEYHLHDPRDPQSHRRSIYRFIARSKTQPFMTVLDCADPSLQVERRNATVSPLQALALLNDGVVLVSSEALAARAVSESGDDVSAQVDRMTALVLCRQPTMRERDVLVEVAQRDGLVAVARILFNLNEFAFLE